MHICFNPADDTMPSKAISVRLPDQMAAELAAIARTQDIAVSEVIREAIENFIVSRRTDKNFQQLLKKRLEEDRKLLERFAE
jgi:metal-responsive CopG/Arc/MetJ family transcriptional regulator